MQEVYQEGETRICLIYDIVMGGVANDRVFDTMELYFENLISRTEAIGRLAMEKPNMQICFRRQEICWRNIWFL